MGRSALGLVTAGAVVLVVACAERREAPTMAPSFHDVSASQACDLQHLKVLAARYFSPPRQQAVFTLVDDLSSATTDADRRRIGFDILELLSDAVADGVNNPTTGSDLANHTIACMAFSAAVFPSPFPIDLTQELDPTVKGAFEVRAPADDDTPVLSRYFAPKGPFSGVAPLPPHHWDDILFDRVLFYGQLGQQDSTYVWKALSEDTLYTLADGSPGIVPAVCLNPEVDSQLMLQVNGTSFLGFVNAEFLNVGEEGTCGGFDDPLGGSATGIKSTYGPGTVASVILTFAVQPTNTALGATIKPPPQVMATTLDGKSVGGVAVTVIAVNNNGTQGVLLGTTTETTSDDGIATFDNLKFMGNGATGGYRLLATGTVSGRGGTVAPATSNKFNVRPK